MKQIIFVLGGPGSGKGTQCKLLEEKFGYKHISAGDLLRNEKSKDTENAKPINNLIANGKIVPSHITINLILDEIDSCDSNIILLDGFPRNMENLETWNKELQAFLRRFSIKHLSAYQLTIEKGTKFYDLYNKGKIPFPVHLTKGNEIQLCKIFQYISKKDWVFCSWRNHYHALLHGISKKNLSKSI